MFMFTEEKAFAGTGNCITYPRLSIDRQHQSFSSLQRITAAMNKGKIRSVHQNGVGDRVDFLIELFRVATARCNGETVVEMKIASSAIVIQAIGNVRVLLNF